MGSTRRNPEDERPHQTRSDHGSRRAHDEAAQHRTQALAEDESEHVTTTGAERHPDADLARAPRDEVGHHTGDANGGLRQREQRES